MSWGISIWKRRRKKMTAILWLPIADCCEDLIIIETSLCINICERYKCWERACDQATDPPGWAAPRARHTSRIKTESAHSDSRFTLPRRIKTAVRSKTHSSHPWPHFRHLGLGVPPTPSDRRRTSPAGPHQPSWTASTRPTESSWNRYRK